MKKSKAPAPPVSGLKSAKDSEQKKQETNDLLGSSFGILYGIAADGRWYPVLKEYCKIDLTDNGGEVKERYKIVAKKPAAKEIFLLEYTINSSTMTGLKQKFVRWSDGDCIHGIQFSKVTSAEEFYGKVTAVIADLRPYARVDKILDQYNGKINAIPVEQFFNSSVIVDKDEEIASQREDNESSDVEQDGLKRRLLQTEMNELLIKKGGQQYEDLIKESKLSRQELVDAIKFVQNKTSDAEPSNKTFPAYHKAISISAGMNLNRDSDHVYLRRCHSVDALSPNEQQKCTIRRKRQAPLPPTMAEDVASLEKGKPARLRKSIEESTCVFDLKEDSILVGKKRRAPRPPGAVVSPRMSDNAAVKSEIAEADGHHIIVCEQNENEIVGFSDEQSIIIRSVDGNQESAAVSPVQSSNGHKEEKHRSLSEKILTDNTDGKASKSHTTEQQRRDQSFIGSFPAEEVPQKTDALLVRLPEEKSSIESFDKNPHVCEDNQQIVSNVYSGDFWKYGENIKPLEEKGDSTRLSLQSCKSIIKEGDGEVKEVFVEEIENSSKFNLQVDHSASLDAVKSSPEEVCAGEKSLMLGRSQNPQKKSAKQFEKTYESLSSTFQPVQSDEAVYSEKRTNDCYDASQNFENDMSNNSFQKQGPETKSFVTDEDLRGTTKEDTAWQSVDVNKVSLSGIDQSDVNSLHRKSTSVEGDHTIIGSMTSEDSVRLTLRVLQHQASSVNQNVARIQSIQNEQEKFRLLNPLLMQRKILEKMITAYVRSGLIPALDMEALATDGGSLEKDTDLESCKSDKINNEEEISHHPKVELGDHSLFSSEDKEVMEGKVYASSIDANKKQMSEREYKNEITNKLSTEGMMYADNESTVFQKKTKSTEVEAGVENLFQLKTGKLLEMTPGNYAVDAAIKAEETNASLECPPEMVENHNEYEISPLLIKESESSIDVLKDGIDVSKSDKFIGAGKNFNQVPLDKMICSDGKELTACSPLATKTEQDFASIYPKIQPKADSTKVNMDRELENSRQASNFSNFDQSKKKMPVALISDKKNSGTTEKSTFSPVQQEEKYAGFDHDNSSQPNSLSDVAANKHFTDSSVGEIAVNNSLGDESPDNDKEKCSFRESAIQKKELLIKQLSNQENRKPQQSATITQPMIGLKTGEEVVGGEKKQTESKTDHAETKTDFSDAQSSILPSANDCKEKLFTSNRKQRPNQLDAIDLKLNEMSALKKTPQKDPLIDVRKISNRNDDIECWNISTQIINREIIKRVKSRGDKTVSTQDAERNAVSEETKLYHPEHERSEAKVGKLGEYSSFQEITGTDGHTKRTVAMRKVRGLQIRSSRYRPNIYGNK